MCSFFRTDERRGERAGDHGEEMDDFFRKVDETYEQKAAPLGSIMKSICPAEAS